MSTLVLQHFRAGVLTNATAVYLRDSLAAYGIQNTSTGAAAVAPLGPLVPVSAGIYEYNADALSPGTYRAAFEQQNTGSPTRWDYLNFTVEDTAAVIPGTKLADLERRVARRVGPFRWLQTTSGNLTTLTANRIKTSIPVGGYEDLFILRRGVLASGSIIANFNADDRIRQVSAYDNVNGVLTNDRAWAIAPIAGEMFELHYLEPEDQLRYSVVEGLRRCFFTDAITVNFASGNAEQKLTSFMPWLTNPEWIKDVLWSYSGALSGPSPVGWARPYVVGSDLYIRLHANPYPNATRFIVLRPVFSYVNGATSLVGPNHDEDVVNVDINYAIAAAHVEAWRNFPDMLMPAAVGGLHPSLPEVAKDFTLLSRTYGRYRGPGQMNSRIQFATPFGTDTSVVVNAGG